jgi:hypothetical protein
VYALLASYGASSRPDEVRDCPVPADRCQARACRSESWSRRLAARCLPRFRSRSLDPAGVFRALAGGDHEFHAATTACFGMIGPHGLIRTAPTSS